MQGVDSGEEVLPCMKGLPVIVISAKADVDHKVELLLGGAVDYMTKPFHTRELLARIAVHLRTFESCGRAETLSFSDLVLFPDAHQVRVNGSDVKLTRTEFAILKMLMQNQTQIISKSQLLDRISQDTPDCTESSLKTHISHLRAKLSAAGGKEYMETIWGIGFRMKQ